MVYKLGFVGVDFVLIGNGNGELNFGKFWKLFFCEGVKFLGLIGVEEFCMEFFVDLNEFV